MLAAVDVRLAASSEMSAVSSFLRDRFHLPAAAGFLDARHLAWKYWIERPDWNGSRSFTARHDGAIVAHVATWPTRIRLPDRVIPAAHLIDWASDPKYPGAGIWLLRRVHRNVPILIATGGTDITRRTLPVLGFRPFGEITSFARPLRPIGQALTTIDRTWRLPARLLRNSVWRYAPGTAPPRDWSAAPAEPHEIQDAIWPAPSSSRAVMARDAAFYDYVLASPSTRHRLFALRHGRDTAGYFCLAYARHVARIADLWVASSAPDDWTAAFRIAAAVAAQTRDMYEVTAWASTALARDALSRAGFRVRDRSTLSVLGDASLLEGRELHVQMLDCDASFLAADEVSYLT